MTTNRRDTNESILSQTAAAAGLPANLKTGIGDHYRAAVQASRANMVGPRTADERIADLRVLAEYERMRSNNPFRASDFASDHAGELASAHLVVDALKEAAPPGVTVTAADAIAALESSKGVQQ